FGARGQRGQREDALDGAVGALLEDALRDPEQQLLLRPEVPEDRALRDADLLRQEIERRALDAACGEEAEGGLDDRLLGANAAFLGGGEGRDGSAASLCPAQSVQFCASSVKEEARARRAPPPPRSRAGCDQFV